MSDSILVWWRISPATQRGDSVFVHVLDWRDRLLAILIVGMRVTRATMLGSGAALKFEQTPDGLTLTVPDATSEPDRVVVLHVHRN